MKREWNASTFESERQDEENAAAGLAAVAEPRFLEGVQRLMLTCAENGEKVVIATVRGKYDAAGNLITGDDDAAGQFRTDAYRFDFDGGESFEVARDVDQEGSGAAAMLAQELSYTLTPDLCRAITDLKVILDRLGGQAWIAPYFHEGRCLGFAFVWDHISKLGRGQEPDARLDEPLPLTIVGFEQPEPQADDDTEPEPEEEPVAAAASSNGSEPSGGAS